MMQIVKIHIDELKPWAKNPRINDHAVDAVAKSIDTFGFNVPILCDQHMTIVAGHTRLKAAKKLGMGEVPVIVPEMTEDQRKAFSIADNKTSEIADWDMPKLRTVLEELRSEDLDLHKLGFSDADLRRMLFDNDASEDEIPEVPRVASTKPGQIYALDVHRLICGNSCDKTTLDLLLENQLIDMVISSPPRFNNLGMGDWACYKDFCRDIEITVKYLSERLTDSSIIFWTSGNSGLISSNFAGLYARLFENEGLEYLDTIAWVRPGVNFASNRVSHMWRNSLYYPARQWEPILVYRKPGKMKKMSSEGKQYMLNFQTDVWEVTAVNSLNEKCSHPTVAPLEIPYRALHAYSKPGDIIVDPFAGSGTTLIAIEKTGLGRRACLIEINPAFCDIIINRWENFTGKRARLLGGVPEEK